MRESQNLGTHATGETFLEFETLTLCYYDTRMIDLARMTPEEIKWINNYHAWVYAEIAPMLSVKEAEFLKEKCKAL